MLSGLSGGSGRRSLRMLLSITRVRHVKCRAAPVRVPCLRQATSANLPMANGADTAGQPSTLADAPVNRINAPIRKRQHALGRLLRHQEAAERGDHQRLFDLVGIELDERAARAVARVVDDHIGRAEGGFDVGEQLRHLGAIGRIAGKGLGAGLLRQRRQIGGAARGERDLQSGLGKEARQRGGKPRADADDQVRFYRHVSVIGSSAFATALYLAPPRCGCSATDGQSITATALISTSSAVGGCCTTCTVVVAGLVSPKNSAQTRLSAS